MTMIYTGTTIAFNLNGKFLQANESHPNFEAIVDAAKAGDFTTAGKLLSLREAVRVATSGTELELRGNSLYLGTEEIRGVLGHRIIAMMREGFDVKPLELFAKNLFQNPSKRAVDELYGFLEASKLPITDDGYFLAYKSVRQDFTDHHTGTMDNSPGTVVEMPRNKVDEDKDRTCSYGLHFAAYKYAEGFGRSGKMVILKINPADVVAIPSDYNNQKGRACQYTILEEVSRSDDSLVDSQIQKVTKDEPALVEPFSDGTRVFLTQEAYDYYASKGKSEYNPAPMEVEGTVQRTGYANAFIYSVQWDNGMSNTYRKGDLAPVKSGVTPSPIPTAVPYVPQADNYEDSNLWIPDWDQYEFVGDAKDFPVNRGTAYDLTRLSDDKMYEGFYFTSYDEKHDNLVFRKHIGTDFQYCTIADVGAWEILTYKEDIKLGS